MVEISGLEEKFRDYRQPQSNDHGDNEKRTNGLYRRNRILERDYAALEQAHADLEIELAEFRVDRVPDFDQEEMRKLATRNRELENECATLAMELRTARAYGRPRISMPGNVPYGRLTFL